MRLRQRRLRPPAPPNTDREALAALYNATGGEYWWDSVKWLSDAPLSEWDGVKTDDDGRVTKLTLVSNALSGEIPPELGIYADLNWLHLDGNDLSGCIPRDPVYLHSSSRLGGLPFC